MSYASWQTAPMQRTGTVIIGGDLSPFISMVQKHYEQDERDGNSNEPKKNRHDVFSFQGFNLATQCLVTPSAVANTAAFGGSEGCGERSDEQR